MRRASYLSIYFTKYDMVFGEGALTLINIETISGMHLQARQRRTKDFAVVRRVA